MKLQDVFLQSLRMGDLPNRALCLALAYDDTPFPRESVDMLCNLLGAYPAVGFSTFRAASAAAYFAQTIQKARQAKEFPRNPQGADAVKSYNGEKS